MGEEATVPDQVPDTAPPTRFAQARGARIAWHKFGSGPTIVAIPPTAQNIEAAWEWPKVREMFRRFGSFSTWHQFDKRGTGASDRRSNNPGIDERVEDLRAVMDDAGVERAFLYGASEGGPTCLMFAATYPHRVEGLILHGTGPYTSPQGLEGEALEAELAKLRGFCELYGTAESPMVDGFAPSLASDPEYRVWHQRYERLATTKDALAEILEISLNVDVSGVLHEIDCPTLVMHASQDLIIPVEWGRLLAREIENAELHVYESIDHFGYVDIGWVDAMERFVTGSVAERPAAPPAAPGQAHIKTLGRFAVEVDGEEVPNSAWGSRQSRQLCKRLVAARGWPVRRDELAAMLWPEEDDATKLGPRLSVQLSAVRRVLGGGVIADRQVVSLNLDEVTVDLEGFMKADDPSTVLDEYEGDFLPGDPDEPWASGLRDEARSRFSEAAHRRLASCERGDEPLARQLISLDPWDERAHLALIRLLANAELAGAARRAYEAYAAAMSEIDVEPQPFEDIAGS